ncbi:MAG TPA: formyl transferase [Hyphomonadaceae bacterium]|jgi:methionyl-tRNA formyltransferase|nr:formyl transferase [Hyphomonadaceae bacterium]HPI47995.1 formyl transferase [Hyphomonadaceae bacterium]
MTASGLIALVGDAPHAWTMVNSLRNRFGDFPVLVERGEPASAFWERRKKKLGAGAVYSMKAAQLAAKVTKPLSRERLAELRAECDAEPVPSHLRIDVDNLNDDGAIAKIRALKPKAVFVASTGMLRRPLLEACACPVVNYHSGVNPAYRGINGGYFALANGEPENFGVTLHLVDLGVDTGPILATNRIETAANDNIQTYMTLMAAKSQDLVVDTMARVLAGEAKPLPKSPLPSAQCYAPTLGQYLGNGLKRGVW